jgi:hypothetical protein
VDLLTELLRHHHGVPLTATPPATNFFFTAGFAGLLAVVAAVIAFWASTRNSVKERWWKRAEYALNLVINGNQAQQLVGIKMLDTLKTRNTAEADFLKTASDLILDPDADGHTDDERPDE